MAEVVVSSVVELLLSTVKMLIQHEIKLVKGVDKELLDLSDKLNKVKNKLYDADMKQFKERTVKDWLRRLEQKSHEMEDVLEEWNYAIIQYSKMESGSGSAHPPKHKVCSFIPSSCFCFKKLAFCHDIAKKVQNLKFELDEILNQKDVDNFVTSQLRSDSSHASWRVQTTSLIDVEEIQGRQNDKNILVKKLTAHVGSIHHVVSIVGAGGLGKTTLAQLIYNDSRVEQCFDFKIWICVSDPFDVEAIAKGVIKVINKQSSLYTTQLDDLLQDLIGCISHKKILLVLDDVWNEQRDKWEPLRNALKCSGAGSKILVTTRKESVATIMGSVDGDIHHPKLLTNEDCFLLLMRMSGRSEDKFEKFHEIGKEIAKKCNGLPLAVKTLGSMLVFKKTIQEWEKVLKSEMWELKNVEVELFPHLLLSYNELSPTLKRCFSFCAFFPKDTTLKVEKLIRIWMALGYIGSSIGGAGDDMELKGREVFEDLAMRSLFQDFTKDELNEQINSCKMHDIVHDFAQFLRKNVRAEDPRITNGTCQVCDPCFVSEVREYRSLDWKKESPLSFCDCLVSVRVFKYSGELSPQGMKKLIHLKWLDMSNTRLSMEGLETICQLYFLQSLSLQKCSIKEIPREIENLVRLRYLDLSGNKELELSESLCRLFELQTLLLRGCSLKEIPSEIGNLVYLKYLDLSFNKQLEELPLSICSLVKLQTLLLFSCSLKEIPMEIGNLVDLRHLNLSWNEELKELPLSIRSMVELQILDIGSCKNLNRLPEGLGQLSGLSILKGFIIRSGCKQFGLMKNLNKLRELSMVINTSSSSSIDMEDLVKDAQEVEQRNKIHLQRLVFSFINEEECSSSSSSSWVDVMEALEPNHNMRYLTIELYKGSRLPHWISSPLNLVREIQLSYCSELVSLPPMGRLLFLKSLIIHGMEKLKVLGVKWLGIRERDGEMMDIPSTSSSSSLVAFPKLRILEFYDCPGWLEWEDITAEQEESSIVSVMPCLTYLNIKGCDGLKMLPHRLLRKASSLKWLCIGSSSKLKECYGDEDGSPRRSISQTNPQLVIELS